MNKIKIGIKALGFYRRVFAVGCYIGASTFMVMGTNSIMSLSGLSVSIFPFSIIVFGVFGAVVAARLHEIGAEVERHGADVS